MGAPTCRVRRRPRGCQVRRSAIVAVAVVAFLAGCVAGGTGTTAPDASGPTASAARLPKATTVLSVGDPAPASADEVRAALGDALDGIIDAGPTRGGAPSTIVDLTGGTPALVRAGAVPWERVLECLA